MNLSPNFTFEELTNTSHTELLESNRQDAMQYYPNLKGLCEFILQPLRNYLNKPITVSSGFRGKALNEAVNGSPTSDHSKGYAADIQVDGMSAEDLMDFIWINKGIFTGKLHKAILEQVNGKEWVHIAYRPIEASGAFYVTKNGKDYEPYLIDGEHA